MEIESSAQWILDQVNQADASCDLIIDAGESLQLKAQDGELEQHKVTSSQVFGVRVIKDDRVGIAYSEASDRDSLTAMVSQAVQNARYTAPDPLEQIITNQATLATDDAILCPAETVSVETRIEFALELEAKLNAKPDVKNVPSNMVQDNKVSRHIFSSAGLHASSSSRLCAAAAFALMEKEDKNVVEGFGQTSRLFRDLDVNSIVNEAYANCIGLIDGHPVSSSRYDVIFDEEWQVDLFRRFASMFSGKSARDGENPMKDKIGEAIADARLNLSDQPLMIEGFGYDLFDAEGTATRATPLITDGVMQTLIHNSVTARHFNLESTGHASRGAKSMLGVGLHQMVMAPGSEEAELYRDEYLLLNGLSGLGPGANPISGNFSIGASGYLCRDGERIQPVRNITVAGNFYELLKQIRAIGETQYWDWQRSALMPRVRFAEVAVSG